MVTSEAVVVAGEALEVDQVHTARQSALHLHTHMVAMVEVLVVVVLEKVEAMVAGKVAAELEVLVALDSGVTMGGAKAAQRARAEAELAAAGRVTAVEAKVAVATAMVEVVKVVEAREREEAETVGEAK